MSKKDCVRQCFFFYIAATLNRTFYQDTLIKSSFFYNYEFKTHLDFIFSQSYSTQYSN